VVVSENPLAITANGEPFIPGTLGDALLAQAWDQGREITVTVAYNAAPVGVGENSSEATVVDFAARVLETVRVRYRAAQAEGAIYATAEITVQDVQAVSFSAKFDATGIYLWSTALPQKTVFISGEELLKRVPGLEDQVARMVSWEENEDAQTLYAKTYEYFVTVFGSWASKRHAEGVDDLYPYSAEIEETATRDAADVAQHVKIRPAELALLVRGLADTFYDDDEAQQAFANLLADQGVTREMMRAAADQLPLLVRDHLQKRATGDENALDVYLYYDAYGIVGVDGVVPALFDFFPFKTSTFSYSRKSEDEGKLYTAKGTVDTAIGAFEGNLKVFEGDVIDNAVTSTLDLSLGLTGDSQGSLTLQTKTYAAIADNKETTQVDLQAVLNVADQTYPLTMTVTSEMQAIQGGDVKGSGESKISLPGMPVSGAKVEIVSGPFKPADIAGNELVNLLTLDAQARQALLDELVQGLQLGVVAGMSALPPETLQLFTLPAQP
jgi:hypothetical protein